MGLPDEGRHPETGPVNKNKTNNPQKHKSKSPKLVNQITSKLAHGTSKEDL